ncbi:hypothetical protein ELQ92_12725 [Labedella populi]|uniref:Uncharacterized protein n=1 Tax=Labedella populi TaxID=2498850 RepID=A0A444Q6Z5_9MICO|nr:hypothetical protein [Labedella populi]RWZ59674.1 hypothetical protein ELQ92_12725 [Labedella populi]
MQSTWPGRTGPTDFRLPDGRDEDELVSTGDFAGCTFPLWFEPVLGVALRGDMVAANGAGYKIVSDRIVEVFDDLDVVGFLSTPADLRDGEGRRVPGFHMLHALPEAPGHEVRPFFRDLPHVWMFEVSARVRWELARRGIGDLRIRPARVVHECASRIVSDPSVLEAP